MALGALPKLCRARAAQVGGSLQRLLVVPGLGPREPAPETHVEPKDAAALLRARRPILGNRDLASKTVALGPPLPAGAGGTHLQVPSHDDLSAAAPGEKHCAQLL